MSKIGILDPDGINPNPLNNKEYSDRYKQLAKAWSSLPGYDKRNDVIKSIQDNQVILIVAETGSGKTVLVPKYALHALNYNGKVGITMPKQIVTKSAAEYAAATLDVNIGEEVGYQYRGSPSDSKSVNTKLLYATDGTIVARLLNDPQLTDFDTIIVDEAHERKVQIDFLLYLLKKAVSLRPSFKIIIMSATINAEIFKDYYKDFKFKQINMSGRTNYPIESIFLDNDVEYNLALVKGFDIVKKLLSSDINDNQANDILFFITSSNEAKDTCKRLYKIENEYDNVFCVEVFSGMDGNRQKLAEKRDLFKKDGKYNRKLVVATNVAESSLTIDGIKYVIDSGYELKSSYDPNKRAKKLDRVIITNAQAKQRMGRAGRTEPGVCYHLYTKELFENGMKKFPEPDIRVSNLSEPTLRLLTLPKFNNINDLKTAYSEFIEPPQQNYIDSAIVELTQLGAIENDKITKLGKLMEKTNMSPMQSLSVIFSKAYKCSNEVINILSLLDAIKTNIGSLFTNPTNMIKDGDKKRKELLKEKYDNARKKFKHKYGDHHTLLNIFTKFVKLYEKNNYQKLKEWAYKHFIKLDPLIKAYKYSKKYRRNIRRVIPKDFKLNDIDLTFNEKIMNQESTDRVLACLIIGHRINIAVNRRRDLYKTSYSNGINIRLDRNSFLRFNKKLPKDVFYSELFISMGKADLNIVSKIPKKMIKIIE